jgi:hypothetical protein
LGGREEIAPSSNYKLAKIYIGSRRDFYCFIILHSIFRKDLARHFALGSVWSSIGKLILIVIVLEEGYLDVS